MFCRKCGAEVENGVQTCPSCGTAMAFSQQLPQPQGSSPQVTPPPTPYGQVPPQPRTPQQYGATQNIPDYLIWAILVTVCCCGPGFIFGIIAIVFSTQVKSKLAAGDVAGAKQSSDNARLMCIIGAALGFVGTAIGVLANLATIARHLSGS